MNSNKTKREMKALRFPDDWAQKDHLLDRRNRQKTFCQRIWDLFVGNDEDREIHRIFKKITKDIESQLNMRATEEPWSWKDEDSLIISCLTDAIYIEKCIEHCRIHPDDSFYLLFWWLGGDASFLVFPMHILQRTGKNIRKHEVVEWLNNAYTVRDVLDYVSKTAGRTTR